MFSPDNQQPFCVESLLLSKTAGQIVKKYVAGSQDP